MQGYPTLWLPGVDHASISAQLVLDRIIAEDGETRDSLGRDRYLERMWQFVNATRDTIADQQRRLGSSVDWSRLRFTMDEGSAKAVRVAFKKLYDDGLAYRGEQLINWCPGDMTSVSDLEVIGKPTTGTLWYVRYHFVDDAGTPLRDETITVATTRPETILGDTAVAVHPDDPRYKNALGRRVLIPFVDRVVPMIADDVVKPEFGTGAVKITPAHDADDFATGKRHNLPLIDVMTDDGHINERGVAYAGLTLDDARSRIVADLEAAGDLEKQEPHEMVLGRCERSDHVVEPRLKTQWFIKTKPMAEKAMAAVREGRTTFVPARFTKVFFDWMENIHDWNVSRQLWWGHRIPAWYCPDGHITVSDEPEDRPPAMPAGDRRPSCARKKTSSTHGSRAGCGHSRRSVGPTTRPIWRATTRTVMETGYDIIFFWVARMMMLGEWLTGSEPFHTVYLHGMVRDPYGGKMSKTKGNVIDPLGVVYETGGDALRFALIHGTAAGADLTSRSEQARRRSQLREQGLERDTLRSWGTTRGRCPGCAAGPAWRPPNSGPPSTGSSIVAPLRPLTVDEAYAEFDFGEAAARLYDAIWSDYCDWYLEIAKIGLADAGASPARKRAIWSVLTWVLDRYLRLLHPIMPMVTEEIWGRLPHLPTDPEFLMVARWPSGSDATVEPDTEQSEGVQQLLDLITDIRAARAESGIAPADWLPAVIWLQDGPARDAFAAMQPAVRRLARIEPTLVDDRATLERTDAISVISTTGEASLTRSLRDRERERARLEKELAGIESQLAAAEARLSDHSFMTRAPQKVVEHAQDRLSELREQARALRERIGEAS